jgi:hypothetical protein
LEWLNKTIYQCSSFMRFLKRTIGYNLNTIFRFIQLLSRIRNWWLPSMIIHDNMWYNSMKIPSKSRKWILIYIFSFPFANETHVKWEKADIETGKVDINRNCHHTYLSSIFPGLILFICAWWCFSFPGRHISFFFYLFSFLNAVYTSNKMRYNVSGIF